MIAGFLPSTLSWLIGNPMVGEAWKRSPAYLTATNHPLTVINWGSADVKFRIETYSIHTRLWGKWILNTPLPIFLNGTTHQVMEIPSWEKRKSMKILDPKEKLWWHHGGSWWRKLASHFPNLLRRWTTKTTGGPNLIAETSDNPSHQLREKQWLEISQFVNMIWVNITAWVYLYIIYGLLCINFPVTTMDELDPA